MSKAVYSPIGFLDLIADSIAGSLLTPTVDLYQSDVALNPWPGDAALIAAVATFAGYAQGIVTWGTPSQADDGTYEVVGTMPVWRPSDSVTPNNIYGCYFRETGGGGTINLAARFDNAPLPMDSALRTITVVIRYRPQTDTLVISVS
jgi:hypothetical protein